MSAWTTDPPTVPGWYWVRHENEPEEEPRIFEVGYVYGLKGLVFRAHMGTTPVEMACAEWSGPIEPPGEEINE